MPVRNQFFYHALIFAAILYALVLMTWQPPAVKPLSAPANEFSGERAYNILSHLLQENAAHPVGSELNKIVKQRIIDELDKLEIANTVQATWQCSRSVYTCTFVENIIATIPGQTDTGYVTLMSHYDSVPMSPGAGDDGAGVAAILETARVLKDEAPFDKPIMLLFTDAEEIGLVGAEAFFNHHPLAKEVGIVLNYEGSGTTGISQVLRTSGKNRSFMNAYQRESSHPKGASLVNEIFKRMPNDTDFSVVMRAGIAGIDIAFANERNHYHTPNDNLENIDIRTIQHHGENMLPISRWLANNDFSSDEPNLVYNQSYSGWLQWPSNYTPYLIIFSIILLAVGYMRTEATAKAVTIGFGGSLLVLIMTGIACYGFFELIKMFHGTVVNWPAYDLPYRITLFASGTLGALVAAHLLQRYLTVNSALIGALLVWVGLGVGIYLYAPDAVNIVVIPLIVTSFLLVGSTFVSEQQGRYILLLSLVALVPCTLGLVLALETTQGYRLIFVTFPFIALFMTIFIPLILGVKLRQPINIAAVVAVLAMITSVMSPLYSEHRPQHVNLIYFEHLENDDSGYFWFSHRNPLPDNLKNVHELNNEKKRLLPYSNYEHSNWVEVTASGWERPTLQVASSVITESGRTVDLILSSQRNANALQLTLPASAGLKSFELGANEYEPVLMTNLADDGYYIIRIIGSFSREVPLRLHLESTESVTGYLIDRSTELPQSGNALLAERQGLLSPVHNGDVAILIKDITF